MGKLLALSTATALATPFEDFFFSGDPIVPDAAAASQGLRAWSGVRKGSELWVVLTPGKLAHTQPSDVHLEKRPPVTRGRTAVQTPHLHFHALKPPIVPRSAC